ncbi:MAG: DinB family protein [Dehalococcoidia bacterium]|nr:DinB family protein [Dehalococcoidia bacterium]
MAEQRVPDPTLMARLQLSVKGIDWAASLVKPWQHEPIEDVWSAHQQLAHLIAVETENFQPRIQRILAEDRPVLQAWDTDAFSARYRRDGDIDQLAQRFMAERATTVELFKALSLDDWKRTGVWPDGREIDLAWLAEKVLWHALDHFAVLLDMHGELEKRQAPRWFAQASETAS